MCGVIVVDAESFWSTWHGCDAYMHNHCLGYRHNFALFYQLLDSNLFTHRNTYAILREATSETYGPRVYLLSYKFPIYFYFVLRFINLLYLSLSDLILASDREGIDNPFIALVSRFLFVCLFRYEGLLRSLLLDWYLGSQTEGNTYLYFAASPFPLQGKNQGELKK